MKIGPWHRIWFALAVALLIFMFIFPHYSVKERVSAYWAYKMERVDKDYERNVRNLRSLKNYSQEDLAREVNRRSRRHENIRRQQRQQELKLKTTYLGEYYVVAILIWIIVVGVVYGLGWVVYYARLEMGLPPPKVNKR